MAIVVSVLCIIVVPALLWWAIVAVLRRFGCSHSRVRCTHGDEIIARNGRRRVCLDCGRALEGPLPGVCSMTGGPHVR